MTCYAVLEKKNHFFLVTASRVTLVGPLKAGHDKKGQGERVLMRLPFFVTARLDRAAQWWRVCAARSGP